MYETIMACAPLSSVLLWVCFKLWMGGKNGRRDTWGMCTEQIDLTKWEEGEVYGAKLDGWRKSTGQRCAPSNFGCAYSNSLCLFYRLRFEKFFDLLSNRSFSTINLNPISSDFFLNFSGWLGFVGSWSSLDCTDQFKQLHEYLIYLNRGLIIKKKGG